MDAESCTVVIGGDGERCPFPVATDGLCVAHYAQAIPWMGMTAAERVALLPRPRPEGHTVATDGDPREKYEGCTVAIDGDGTPCARATIAGGMCEAHYQQTRRYGTPIVGQPLRRQRRYTGPRGETCRCCGQPNDGKGGHGLRHACYEVWRRAGSPDTYKGIDIFDAEVNHDREGDPVPARG